MFSLARGVSSSIPAMIILFFSVSKSLSRHIFYQNIYTSENKTVYGKDSYRPLPLDTDVKFKYFDRRKLPWPKIAFAENFRRRQYPAKAIFGEGYRCQFKLCDPRIPNPAGNWFRLQSLPCISHSDFVTERFLFWLNVVKFLAPKQCKSNRRFYYWSFIVRNKYGYFVQMHRICQTSVNKWTTFLTHSNKRACEFISAKMVNRGQPTG